MNDKPLPLNWEKLENEFKEGHSIVLFLGTGVNYGLHGINFSWDALINHLLSYAISKITLYGESDTAESLISSTKKLIKDWEKEEKVKVKENEIMLDKKDFERLKKQITIDSLFSRDVKTTIVKQKLGNRVYINLIRDFIYSKADKKRIYDSVDRYCSKKNDAKIEDVEFFNLTCLADLILRNKNIRAVVTQNYDQFLCDALTYMKNKDNDNTYRKITPLPIHDWTDPSKFSYDNINIYHVHGFIPRYDEIQPPNENKVVLSMDEFYEDTRNVYSWQIASQLHFLSQYTCIFCGLSLDDYTNQRLLHYVKNKHRGNLYYLTAGEVETRITDRIKNEYHEKNGLTVLYDEKGFSHLYALLKNLKYEQNI